MADVQYGYPGYLNPSAPGGTTPVSLVYDSAPDGNDEAEYAKGGLVDAAHKIRGAGRYGDTETVHMNKEELAELTQKWGPPTINPDTGMPEFFLKGLWKSIKSIAPIAAAFIPGIGPAVSTALKIAAVGSAASSLLGSAKKSSAGSSASTAAQQGIGGAGMNNMPLPKFDMAREKVPITFDPFTYGQGKPGQKPGQKPKNQFGEFEFFRKPAAPVAPAAGIGNAYGIANPDLAAEGRRVVATGEFPSLEAYYQWHAANYANEGRPYAAASAPDIAPATVVSEPMPEFAEGGEADGDDMISHLMSYSQGGGHQGPGRVKGIGSGQADKIPAWLSDGEYVWSAQDVADLGDGSTDEGVRRLDKMRHMVRGQAGRKDIKKIAKPQRGIDHMLKAVGGAV